MANDPSATSEPARWIKLRASAAERARWQALAASRGMSLSELIRASLGGLRLRTRLEPPPVAPELLRELAQLEGLRLLRLLYCYPSYFTDELIQEIADNDKVTSFPFPAARWPFDT